MASKKRLQITEHDDAGNVAATYVHSTASTPGGPNRIDVILPKETKSPWQKLLDVFLPAGYPHSVTEDYLEYQIYDSLQAFASSIASLLSSRAVLSSIGVGDSSASPTAALALSTFQETFGRLATIAFAHHYGTALEPETKRYRLLADILNDVAFVLDCLSPVFPKAVRVVVFSAASGLRALCGVAAGSAKPSLSKHFAREGNLGELNAKDGSQETVISLFGMLVGTWVVGLRALEGQAATWVVLMGLLAVHLECNRRAVRAVCMRTLNRQRAGLVLQSLVAGRAQQGTEANKRSVVPTPKEIAAQESIFERDGVLRDEQGGYLGTCTIGVSMSRLLEAHSASKTASGSFELEDARLAYLLGMYRERRYLLGYTTTPSKKGNMRLQIVLKKGATPLDQLEAWWHALLVARSFDNWSNRLARTRQEMKRETATPEECSDDLYLAMCRDDARQLILQYEGPLREAGWDLDAAALETSSSIRIEVEGRW